MAPELENRAKRKRQNTKKKKKAPSPSGWIWGSTIVSFLFFGQFFIYLKRLFSNIPGAKHEILDGESRRFDDDPKARPTFQPPWPPSPPQHKQWPAANKQSAQSCTSTGGDRIPSTPLHSLPPHLRDCSVVDKHDCLAHICPLFWRNCISTKLQVPDCAAGAILIARWIWPMGHPYTGDPLLSLSMCFLIWRAMDEAQENQSGRAHCSRHCGSGWESFWSDDFRLCMLLHQELRWSQVFRFILFLFYFILILILFYYF
jgi:hypothetical protein